MIRWPDKDPSEALEYSLDLSAMIAEGDTVSEIEWSATPSTSPGIVVTGADEPANPAQVTIAGGIAGTTYVITCTATLTSELVIEKSIMLKVREQ